MTTHDPAPSRLRGLCRLAGGFVALIGTAVLVGWLWQIDALTRTWPGQVEILANTALCFALAGLGLWLVARQPPGRAGFPPAEAPSWSDRWTRLATTVILCAVLVVAGLTLIEYLTRVDLGLDELLADAPGGPGTAHPGRMAPNTAVAFLLLSGALLALSSSPRRRAHLAGVGLLAVLTFLLGSFTVLGYAAHVVIGHGWGTFTSMALSTGLLFMLLGAASLSLAWNAGNWRWSLPERVVVEFTLGLLILIANSLLSFNSVQQSQEAAGLVRHSSGILAAGWRVNADAAHVQTSMRGYVLTGREAFLQVYRQAQLDLMDATRALRRLRADDPLQQKRLLSLASLSDRHITFAQQAVDLRRNAAGQAATALIAPGRGLDLLEDIRAVTADIEREERTLLARREAELGALTARTSIIMPVGTFVSLGLFIAVLFYLNAEVTDRREAEGASRRLAAIVDSTTDAVIGQTLDGTITSWNLGAEHLYGRSAREAVGRSIGTLFPPDSEGEVEAILGRIRQGERIETFDTVRVRKDGRLVDVSATISPVTDAAGQVVEASTIARDITARKQTEDRLTRVAKALELSNQELERFAYVSSHDLQEPLRTVASFSQLLATRYQGRLDTQADEFIGFIVDGATRMQALINDLLAYSRIGRQGTPFEPVDVEEALTAVLADLAHSIEVSHASVTHDPLPVVQGDSVQLRQLLQNLVANAIKFHRRDVPPIVHVTAVRDGTGWQFDVRDNGIGMDPQYVERVFIIFQRLHGREDYPGTGIGLAVCKKIAERHGGRIWVDAAPGGGATFHFTLPDRMPDL